MAGRPDPRVLGPPGSEVAALAGAATNTTGLENQLDSPKGNSRDGKVVKGDALVRQFWAKVDRRGERDCWLWTAKTNGRYGYVALPGRRHVGAHRVAWELTNGPIPAGQVVHHICRSPLCVNPAHLRVGSQAENVMRDNSPPAVNAHKVACVWGHEFQGGNVRIYTRRSGEVERVCVACEQRRNRAKAQARRAEA
jgi:hypothetical protein